MRYLQPYLQKDLKKKMVFLGGPRQVGKTTLAQSILKELPTQSGGVYYNWDDDEDRRAILKRSWSDRDQLLLFDELHKFPRWKNWIKGIYDKQHGKHSILVTGSARLDVYRRGGDSLLGRYHYWRLHPLSLSEHPSSLSKKAVLRRLMNLGGFPEPFFDNDENEARRWRKERFDRIIKGDIRDLESVKHIQNLSLLIDLLRTRVGGMVVLSNLAADLQVSPKSIQSWLNIFEKMYLLFVVKPFTTNLARAVRKPPKVYFFDNADVIGDEGARFENLVATHLLKTLHFLEDWQGHNYELRYLRDKEGREVDFVIVKNGNIEMLVEAKLADNEPSRPLTYYSEKLKAPIALQIVCHLKRPKTFGRLHIVDSFEAFSQFNKIYDR